MVLKLSPITKFFLVAGIGLSFHSHVSLEPEMGHASLASADKQLNRPYIRQPDFGQKKIGEVSITPVKLDLKEGFKETTFHTVGVRNSSKQASVTKQETLQAKTLEEKPVTDQAPLEQKESKDDVVNPFASVSLDIKPGDVVLYDLEGEHFYVMARELEVDLKKVAYNKRKDTPSRLVQIQVYKDQESAEANCENCPGFQLRSSLSFAEVVKQLQTNMSDIHKDLLKEFKEYKKKQKEEEEKVEQAKAQEEKDKEDKKKCIGLSESELGDCLISWLEKDPKKIKDPKERAELLETQKKMEKNLKDHMKILAKGSKEEDSFEELQRLASDLDQSEISEKIKTNLQGSMERYLIIGNSLHMVPEYQSKYDQLMILREQARQQYCHNPQMSNTCYAGYLHQENQAFTPLYGHLRGIQMNLQGATRGPYGISLADRNFAFNDYIGMYNGTTDVLNSAAQLTGGRRLPPLTSDWLDGYNSRNRLLLADAERSMMPDPLTDPLRIEQDPGATFQRGRFGTWALNNNSRLSPQNNRGMGMPSRGGGRGRGQGPQQFNPNNPYQQNYGSYPQQQQLPYPQGQNGVNYMPPFRGV